MRFALVGAACLLAGIAGCGGGGNDIAAGSNLDPNTIVGRWAADSIQGPGGSSSTCPTSLTIGGQTFACGLIDTQVFDADGTYEQVKGGERGTWSVNGSTLTIRTSATASTTYTYSVQGPLLYEQVSSSAGPVVYRFRRQ